MIRTVEAATWAACALAAGTASASPPRASSLPLAHPVVVPEPASAPRSIASGASIDGFFVASAPASMRPTPAPGHVALSYGVFTSGEDAAEFSKRGQVLVHRGRPACFTAVNAAAMEAGAPWGGTASSMATLYTEAAHGAALAVHGNRVWAVHAEEIAREGGPRLLITDAWVDGLTGGARLLSRSSLPLVELARGPRDATVYAARHARGVEIVVTAPEQPEIGEALRPFTTSTRELVLQSSFRFASSDCGHVRFGIDDAGIGETAVVRTEVVVKLEEAARESRGLSGVARAMLGGLAGGDEGPRGELRLRPLAIFVSSSRTASDPERVLGASFGWSSRARTIEL